MWKLSAELPNTRCFLSELHFEGPTHLVWEVTTSQHMLHGSALTKPRGPIGVPNTTTPCSCGGRDTSPRVTLYEPRRPPNSQGCFTHGTKEKREGPKEGVRCRGGPANGDRYPRNPQPTPENTDTHNHRHETSTTRVPCSHVAAVPFGLFFGTAES